MLTTEQYKVKVEIEETDELDETIAVQQQTHHIYELVETDEIDDTEQMFIYIIVLV